jgi:hypothetical protein
MFFKKYHLGSFIDELLTELIGPAFLDKIDLKNRASYVTNVILINVVRLCQTFSSESRSKIAMARDSISGGGGGSQLEKDRSTL